MASNKSKDTTRKRPYTLRARAKRQEEVHLRITKAAAQLHGTVGPARTTVSDIARLAGVRRATVYNHFPTDLDIIDACSSHWFSQNPPPDPTSWTEITDPRHRTEVALLAMYDYYDRSRHMLENVLRDATLVTALDEILRQKWWPMMEGLVEMLAMREYPPRPGKGISAGDAGRRESRPPAPAADVELRASLRVALDFFTWQTLAESGLSNERAARLATAWVETGSTFPGTPLL